MEAQALPLNNSSTIEIDDLVFQLAHITGPSWYMNPDLQAAFKDRAEYDALGVGIKLLIVAHLFK